MAKIINRVFGSKSRVAGELLRLVPPGLQIWIECFAGSAALTLAKQPHKSEHINDLDDDVINLFRVLRNREQRDRLEELVSLTPWAQSEFEACRLGDEPADPVDRARGYLVRSWQGFNGAVKSRTGWVADRCASKVRPRVWAELPERIAVAAERLKDVHVHKRHCFDILGMFGDRPDACIFIDPPYPRRSITSHGQVYMIEMSAAEHAEFARRLRSVRAPSIVTMSVGTVYDEELGDWWHTDIQVRGLRNKVKAERVFCNFTPAQSGLFSSGAAA